MGLAKGSTGIVAVAHGSTEIVTVHHGPDEVFTTSDGGGSSELVGNGTFDSDASGWNGVNGTLSAVAGWGRLTSSATPAYANQSIATVPGATYTISGEWRSSAGTWRIIVGTSAGGSQLLAPSAAAAGSLNTSFVASGATAYVSLRSGVITVGDYSEMDNISVVELT